ncbi:hypothetical protein [Paenibacillus glacialis]|uniref:Uncharacterized protein n=1 Tax=Paenibacillus glacialis TaxID=494026 RepID=A0A162K7L7_9BACL|nr:hypothetical protein [Paenibacillus glacialis]OAB44196.1 hypothetical protein PGLA_05865 [Paenibacillus glacialis]
MKGGVIVSVSSKKNKTKKKEVRISNKGQCTNGSTPNLTPQQISLIGALLAGFFNIDSVIYTRDNILQVLLTTDKLTELPILGPPSKQQQTDILNAIDIVASNESNLR